MILFTLELLFFLLIPVDPLLLVNIEVFTPIFI